MTLTPDQKYDLILDLTSVQDNPLLNHLIRDIINRAETLADVHYGLSACTQVLKAANGRVVERMEAGRNHHKG